MKQMTLGSPQTVVLVEEVSATIDRYDITTTRITDGDGGAHCEVELSAYDVNGETATRVRATAHEIPAEIIQSHYDLMLDAIETYLRDQSVIPS